MEKVLKVYNPNNLPTMPYTQFVEFQGDLKEPITPEDLKKMRGSLKKHGVFVPKFVWFDEENNANILDGHQTKQALSSLEADGWTIPEIPYAQIEADNRQDAAEKLLQINSQYAKMNIESEWLHSLPNLDDILNSIVIPDFSEFLVDNPIDVDKELSPTKSQLEKPFRKIHVLLSIPVNRYHEVSSSIEEILQHQFIESVQSGN